MKTGLKRDPVNLGEIFGRQERTQQGMEREVENMDNKIKCVYQ